MSLTGRSTKDGQISRPPRQHYCVLEIVSGAKLYPRPTRMKVQDPGTSEYKAAVALVPGATFGVGRSPREAEQAAEAQRQWHLTQGYP